MSENPHGSAHEPGGADAAASARLRQAAQSAHRKPDTPLLEWVFAAIGFALVGATICFLIWHGLDREGAPPRFAFEVEAIAETANGYLVAVSALNGGDTTAADVKVRAELLGPAGVVETSEMSFKFLPPRSSRKGGLYFSRDPRQFNLRLTALGYEAP